MFQSRARTHWPWVLAFAAVFVAISLVIDNSYYQLIMTNVLVWATMGLAWNLLSGYSGLVSFGHAAFFGLGAYFTVLAQINWNLSPWLGIPVAGVLGAAAGLIVGIPTFRLRGHYFALAMLAYPLAMLYVFEWLGYQEVAVPRVTESAASMMQFEDRRIYIWLALGITLIVMAVSRYLERGRYGMSLVAIKQDETAAEAAGIHSTRWKLIALTLSGAIAAAIGGFYAVVQLIVTPPSVFGVLVSAQALIVAMFGGVGTFWGPVIGATTLVPLSAWLDAELAEKLPGIQGVVYGFAIVAVILAAPEGLFWRVRDALTRHQRFQPSSPPDEATTQNPSTLKHDKPARRAVDAEQHPVLSVTGLSKTYGGLRAVDNASFDVRRGEILGIIGPNGAGKTTLFNILNGFVKPDAGSVAFAGQEITGERPSRICDRGLGRTFQVVKPFNRMTIADNVVVGAFVRNPRMVDAQNAARQALKRVGLEQDGGRIAGAASNEQLRLMELARALASSPTLLLLDEVFAGLSADEVDKLMNVIRSIRTSGVTVVIIEHTMQAMVRLVDRFVVLNHGAVLTTGSPQEITSNPAVIEAYLGPKWAQNA